MSMFDLEGKVAVVIGATSGLGREIALGLARAGADVVPCGRRAKLCDEVAAEIQFLGRRSIPGVVDATSRESLQTLREHLRGEIGPTTVLVNAAGRTVRKPAIEVTDAEWDQIFDTNVGSMLKACQVFYADLIETKGCVVNIASLASTLAFHQVAAYNASKSAVMGLTRSLACEWAREGVRVNAICPGVFPTELNIKSIMGTPRGEEMLLRTPMGRFGKPEELVGAAVFLASDAASFVTGHGLAVDGGYLASGVNS